jgi:hypothetical protein
MSQRVLSVSERSVPAKQVGRAHAIVVDRPRQSARSRRRRSRRGGAGAVVWLLAAPGTGVRVLLEALTTAFESATPPPFTFTIENPAQGLATAGATETCPVADRLQGRFMATRPGAAGRRQNNFCCVTTRCRIHSGLCRLRRRPGSLPARTLRFGVLSFDCGIEPAPGLSLRCLPAAEQSSAFGILAVTLVPASRLVSAATALA